MESTPQKYDLLFMSLEDYAEKKVSFTGRIQYTNEGAENQPDNIRPTRVTNVVTINPTGEEDETTRIHGTWWKIDAKEKKGTDRFYNITVRGGEGPGGDIEYIFLSLVTSYKAVTVTGESDLWGIAGQAVITMKGSQRQYLVMGKEILTEVG